MTIKHQLYQHCLAAVNQRLMVCEQSLTTVQESLASETKSSAGDKHETGRAMIQLEREKLGAQLAAIEYDKAMLLKVDPELKLKTVGLGSLVLTSQHNYFLAISSGKVTIDKERYYSISLNSPIGQVLAGKRVGEHFSFRDQEIEVLEIH